MTAMTGLTSANCSRPMQQSLERCGRQWIGPRFLLITNRKLYTGSRLPPNSMTLDDLEQQNRVFNGFFGNFGLRDTFQERIALKSIEIDMEKLHMKFLALDTDVNSLDFLGSRKPAHEGIKEWYLFRSFTKLVADRHGHAVYHNKHSD